jgi:hypothetical protein
MDMINIETNDIRLSVHTPDFPEQWVRLQNVDFSGIGISPNEVNSKLLRIPKVSYTIQNHVARWIDWINIETNEIKFSIFVPDETGLWLNPQDIDFSGIGIPDVSTAEGKVALRRIARRSYVIESLAARWKTDEELYDLEAARAEKMLQLQLRVLEVVRDRAGSQVDEPWRGLLEEISGDQVAVFGSLLGLCYVLEKTISTNDIKTAYVDLKGHIEAATTKDELDAIVIP